MLGIKSRKLVASLLAAVLVSGGCVFVGHQIAGSSALEIEVQVASFQLRMEEDMLKALLEFRIRNPTPIQFWIVDGWFTLHLHLPGSHHTCIYTMGEGRLLAPVSLQPYETASASASFMISYLELKPLIVQAIEKQVLSKISYRIDGSLTAKTLATFSFYVLFATDATP